MSILGYILLLGTTSILSSAQEGRFTEEYENQQFGPYLHVYPPVNFSQSQIACSPSASDPCPLYLALMFSFPSDAGNFVGGGVVPAIQLAIDQMNSDPSFLPGYRLHYLLMDSMVVNNSQLLQLYASF